MHWEVQCGRRVGSVSWNKQPRPKPPSPSGKITEFLLLKGLRVEHKKLLVDLKMEGKIGIPRKRTINAHLGS